MERLLLALIVFWRILFGDELPLARLRAAGLLPASRLPVLGSSVPTTPMPTAAPVTATVAAPVAAPVAPPAPPPSHKQGKKGKRGQSERMAVATAPAPEPAAPQLAPPPPATVAQATPAPAPVVVREVVREVVRDLVAEQTARDEGALLMLAAFQREGRLLDFLMEKIDAYSDDQVGAAVRGIHSGCSKAVGATLIVEPVLKGSEESPVTLESGYDTKAIRLTGNVRGQPPFKGTLKHHGWRVRPQKPLAPALGSDPAVVMPAEVEL